jgi:hypothetical protein
MVTRKGKGDRDADQDQEETSEEGQEDDQEGRQEEEVTFRAYYATSIVGPMSSGWKQSLLFFAHTQREVFGHRESWQSSD